MEELRANDGTPTFISELESKMVAEPEGETTMLEVSSWSSDSSCSAIERLNAGASD